MKGYFNKPGRNKSVFTEDGWFKTGDAGNIDDQGNLTITERIKDLLKTSNGKIYSTSASGKYIVQ